MSLTIIEKAQPTWTIDRLAVERLLGEWGITEPVTIVNRLEPCDCGACRNLPDGGASEDQGLYGRTRVLDDGSHVIQLNSTRTADETNETLVHELRHVEQAERFVTQGKSPAAFESYNGLLNAMWGYWDNPLEVDARRAADELAPLHRLVREVGDRPMLRLPVEDDIAPRSFVIGLGLGIAAWLLFLAIVGSVVIP